jgi:hypothetical protein
MMRITLLVPALALALAACQQTAPPPPAAPAATPAKPVGRAPSGPAETACAAALAKQNQVTGVTVVSSEVSQAGTSVTLLAPNAEKPWMCAWQRGKVVNMMYMGEG